MESKLPDLNVIWINYRKAFYYALLIHQTEMARNYLYAINATLPDEYKVEINGAKYAAKSKTHLKVFCPQCEAQSDLTSVTRHIRQAHGWEFFKTGGKLFVETWVCPECETESWVKGSNMAQLIKPVGKRIGVVPEPPELGYSQSKRSYTREFRKWALNMMRELDGKLADLRNDYVSVEMGQVAV